MSNQSRDDEPGKNKGGRPRKYNSAEEIEGLIETYFAECKIEERIPTMAGLGLALDMTTETLRMYSKEDEFSATIKKARQLVEMAWEERLTSGGSGPIFWLKNNAGWNDVKEFKGSMGISFSDGLKAIGNKIKSNPELEKKMEDELTD